MDAKDRKIEQLEQTVAAQQAMIETLLMRIEQLEAELAKARKDSSNSSKPPSSDIVKPTRPTGKRGRRKKRKPGGQNGHAKHTREPFTPEQIDETIEYELTDQDAGGLTPLNQWRTLQQIELVDRPFIITEHRARLYLDKRTGKTIAAPLPPEVEKAGLVGTRLSAVIGYQKSACHMSYTTIANFWNEVGDFTISRARFIGRTTGRRTASRVGWRSFAPRS